ncbi:MAG: aspartate--tRNA ligase, partial [Clostridia bacterium]|nr:aspartate--tRNA ligase [Clostridia bacterium]
MAEMLSKSDKRTNYCGELRTSDIGKRVCVMGWAARVRDLGSLIFIDLRDRTGIVQLAFDEKTEKEIFDKAFRTRTEYVLVAKGVVRQRSSINKQIPTGDIEIFVDEYKIISAAQTTPFEINDGISVKDELALKYRYLDLRRPSLTKNILMRHEIAKAAREYYYQNGFIEIETPMMIKSTPEGARDYLVPSRIHKGSFYALPQSPQIYKQLTMVAGFDRYIQLARCFRDEDLRADRQPEFTQIDLEMSFIDQDDIMDMSEGFMIYVYKKVLGIDLPRPFPRLKFADAMNRYGSDKPDTRFG